MTSRRRWIALRPVLVFQSRREIVFMDRFIDAILLRLPSDYVCFVTVDEVGSFVLPIESLLIVDRER